MKLTINAGRLAARIDQLSQIGAIGETGVCRLALSKEDKEAVELVKGWFREGGLQAHIDAFGNLIGRIEGRRPDAPVLMMGSHIDSQPYAGRFDGTVGVLGALEVIQTFTERGFVPEMPIELAAFCDEEGCRFNKGLFGVRGILGQLEEGELDRTDKNGISRRQALIDFGCDPEAFERSRYRPGRIGSFLEMHIEQGPVLESLNQPIGIVTGISGPLWWTVEFAGFAGHAGSVPMALRNDALVGAAKVIVALNELASREPGAPTVGTVGSVSVFPDSRNIIPEKVRFTVDLRDIELSRRNRLEALLRETIEQTASEHGLSYTITEDTNSEPRYCSPRIMDVMRKGAGKLGLAPPELMSGPFHDALALSYVCDYGMIFIRCKEGISHNPKEYACIDDLALGTELLYHTALEMASSKTAAPTAEGG
ncbi:hydantoinase [Paenibacillus darwinianus]|uniref:Hydantoinase n=1 Tax=Paenibacillus darwinianus TaxID=1380763 RepID=A0A9W5W623_9BACL|nr:M20 family metallo-hydrolase [Paenibacillus darwinianus]EXX85013.1 hydantoinase [Paenibacillus darwinianus]EXX86237.1 hydantoinase [Paenibacillus darwinianus]EXX86651.1 hydantoinase [Paenibacillus darwinianus]